MKSSKKGTSTNFRGCIICKYGHFVENPPLTGECRFNPPRQFIDKDNGATRRHFVHVRFDDWCGKLQAGESLTKEQSENLLPYLSPEQVYADACRALNEGEFVSSLEALNQLYAGELLTRDMLFEVSEVIYKSLKGNSEDSGLIKELVTWRCRAADMEHPEACYLYALTLVQSQFRVKDEIASRTYLLKAADLGNEKAQERVEDGKFFTINLE